MHNQYTDSLNFIANSIAARVNGSVSQDESGLRRYVDSGNMRIVVSCPSAMYPYRQWRIFAAYNAPYNSVTSRIAAPNTLLSGHNTKPERVAVRPNDAWIQAAREYADACIAAIAEDDAQKSAIEKAKAVFSGYISTENGYLSVDPLSSGGDGVTWYGKISAPQAIMQKIAELLKGE